MVVVALPLSPVRASFLSLSLCGVLLAVVPPCAGDSPVAPPLLLAAVGLATVASLALAALLLRGLPALCGLVAFRGFGLPPLAADRPMARLPCPVAWCWLWFAAPPLAVAACCSRALSAGWCLWHCHLVVVRGPSAGVVVVAALWCLRPGFLFFKKHFSFSALALPNKPQ